MAVLLGNGSFRYEALEEWARLPQDMDPVENPGVAVDSKDRVYVLTRNPDYPVLVLERDGTFLRSFGQGVFSQRTHGVLIGPDDTIYIADDGTHVITIFTPDGELLKTIGERDRPAEKWGGEPFNRPTHAAVSRTTGDIFISDGYGNSRVHKYSPDGRHILSWGAPGIDAGQFMYPHNIAVDQSERVYIADRESHRVQIFDTDGNFLTMWNNIHRPCGLTIGPDGNTYVGELNGFPGVDAPGIGHRISIYSPEGKLLARLGDETEGDGPGQFVAPHGIAVDSHGDIYVGEVAYTILGQHLTPPRRLRSLKKLRRVD
jgi:DNA-binding beta-propeller fold protein YncE